MKVAALAGGIGAGKFLRGLARVIPPEDLHAIVNTGDDREFHGLWVSPDLDSVTYWLGGVMDRERGWGLAGETFRATEELRKLGAPDAWFGLGDLDLATHLFRSHRIRGGLTLTEVTGEIRRRFAVEIELLPMSDDRVSTMIETTDREGREERMDFQTYWVKHEASVPVTGITYEGASDARPAPGVLETLRSADTIVICPSNPVASIFPILAVPGIREVLHARRERVVGISPIIAGAPVRGMADRLMPAAGFEVSALGAARCYEGLLAGWVIDERDAALASKIEETGSSVAVTGTIMADDEASERIARVALDLL